MRLDWSDHDDTHFICVPLWCDTVDFSCVLNIACTGKLCFGKCSVLHCSLRGVQTIHSHTECSNAPEINLTGHGVCSIFALEAQT